MRLLMVATKAPWPPIDGGRLLLLRTIQGLAAAGVRPTLVAPFRPTGAGSATLGETAAALAPWCDAELVAAGPAGLVATLWRAALGRLPLSIARHTVPAVRQRVAALLASGRFDLVHAEQLQALPQALAPARAQGLPVVLRAQNVESALWAAAGKGRALAFEARRLAAWEGRAVGAVDATLALTSIDAAMLRRLAASAGAAEARVLEVPAPFAPIAPFVGVAPIPGVAPASAGRGSAGAAGEALDGEPAVVVLGSRGWRPNEDAVSWFRDEIWPAVLRALPAARLHVFGLAPPVDAARRRASAAGSSSSPAAADPIVWHGVPADSAAAFAPGSVHVVPLRFGSGVRMKVLEAWARGIPVVATPEGAAGLEATDGVELLIARDAAAFVAALRRLRDEPARREALAAAGRDALRRRHDPAVVARRLLSAYDEVLTAYRPAGRPTTGR